MFFVIFLIFVTHNVGGFEIGAKDYESNPFLVGLLKPKPPVVAPAVTSPPVPQELQTPGDFTVNGQPQFDSVPELPGNNLDEGENQAPAEINKGELMKWCLAPRGQFPSGYCNKFVNCWEGNVVEQFCPQTLMFSSKGYCDYAENVDCQGKPVQIQPQVVEGPGAGSWPSDGSYIPPSQTPPITNPSLPPFTPVITPPPPPKQPESPSTNAPPPKQPESPSTNAPPPSNPSTTTSSVVPSSPATVIDGSLKELCLLPRGQFAGRKCGTFVNCWDDVVLEQECPGGLNFNQLKGYCDFPHNAPCKAGLESQEPLHDDISNALAEVEKPSDCPEPYGTFKNATNCAGYYTCVDGKVVIQFECPKGYLFNSAIGVCDLEFRVDCRRGNSENNHIPLPPAIVNPSFRCLEGTVYRLNESCSKVALCRNGITEIVDCPAGLTYDVTSDKCLPPILARC